VDIDIKKAFGNPKAFLIKYGLSKSDVVFLIPDAA